MGDLLHIEGLVNQAENLGLSGGCLIAFPVLCVLTTTKETSVFTEETSVFTSLCYSRSQLLSHIICKYFSSHEWAQKFMLCVTAQNTPFQAFSSREHKKPLPVCLSLCPAFQKRAILQTHSSTRWLQLLKAARTTSNSAMQAQKKWDNFDFRENCLPVCLQAAWLPARVILPLGTILTRERSSLWHLAFHLPWPSHSPPPLSKPTAAVLEGLLTYLTERLQKRDSLNTTNVFIPGNCSGQPVWLPEDSCRNDHKAPGTFSQLPSLAFSHFNAVFYISGTVFLTPSSCTLKHENW